MKRALTIIGIALAALLVVQALPYVGIVALYGVVIRRTLDTNRTFLLKKVDHRAVAKACLELVTKPEYQALIGQCASGSDPRLPEAIRNIKPFWLSMGSNEVLIMKTGGHYHMGYLFRPSLSGSNQYDLVFREERDLEHDVLLCSVQRR